MTIQSNTVRRQTLSLRKDSASRVKELKLAIYRIEKGRAVSGGSKLTISSVAREVGISAALIHNHYPAIAELIRAKQGASSRQQRNAKQTQLEVERQKNKSLNGELEGLRKQVNKLSTINEMLVVENKELSAMQRSGNVYTMNKKNR